MTSCRDGEARGLMRAALQLLLRSRARNIGPQLPDTCDLAIMVLAEIADEMYDGKPVEPL